MTPDIHRFFAADAIDLPGLSAWLDGLTADARREETATLSKREQARLFDQAKGFRPVTLQDFVPPAVPDLKPVIHFGRNSLPVFRRFQKRFSRPRAIADRLWGYNEQALRPVTGPGYFQVRASDPGEVVIDYTEVPSGTVEGWPPVKDNRSGLGRLVYGGMQDHMRGVSAHVSIGRAFRGGKWADNWFVLCRES